MNRLEECLILAESTGNYDYINEFKDEIKNYYSNRRTAEIRSGKAGHNGENKEIKKDLEISKNKGYRNSPNYDPNRKSHVNTAKNGARSSNAQLKNFIANRRSDRDEFSNDKKEFTTTRGTKTKTLNSNDRKRERKAAMKEACLEWYLENGYEINDYELGRIDMFVEQQMSDEHKQDLVQYSNSGDKEASELLKKKDTTEEDFNKYNANGWKHV